jgi:putative transcriptional regulator
MNAKHFSALVASVREAGNIRRGEVKPAREFRYAADEVRAIRAKLGKSQSDFAEMIGVPKATVQNWEQGRRVPDGPASALLRVVSQSPRAVTRALASRKAR